MSKLPLHLKNTDDGAPPATSRDSSYVERLTAMAIEAQITLSGFHTNTELELYFDFLLDDEIKGYVYKGWDDPGVRIADVVYAPATALDDLLFFEFLADRCSLEGVMLTRDTDEACPNWLLEAVIYTSGLNALTLREVAMSMINCVSLVKNASATHCCLNAPALYGRDPSSVILC